MPEEKYLLFIKCPLCGQLAELNAAGDTYLCNNAACRTVNVPKKIQSTLAILRETLEDIAQTDEEGARVSPDVARNSLIDAGFDDPWKYAVAIPPTDAQDRT